MNQKWYEKNLAIILFLIFFFPVGLFLMWKYSKWNKTIKIVISVFFGLILIWNISNNKNNTTVKDNATVQKQQKEILEDDKLIEEITSDVDPGITKEYIESKSKEISIINIDNSGDNYYTIDFKVKDVVSDSYYKKSILGEIKDISKILNNAGLVTGNEFFFEAKGKGTDKYGNEVDMNYATAFVKGDELTKCNFDNINSEDFEVILQSFDLNKSLQ